MFKTFIQDKIRCPVGFSEEFNAVGYLIENASDWRNFGKFPVSRVLCNFRQIFDRLRGLEIF